tara:strand:- start:626 stop:805 length:180 start_codon:yes stop_codon:yes gene_type:complete
MKVSIAIIGGLIVLGYVGANIIEGFKNSPTGKVVEQLQERKELIEEFTKSPITQPLLNK